MYYYVLYLINPRVFVVVPYNWLRGGDSSILEKFVDKGLNSNQKHLCFYSREGEHVAPNFHANIANEFPSREAEACYHCFVIKFKCMSASLFILIFFSFKLIYVIFH